MKTFLAYLGHLNIDIIFNVPKLLSSGSITVENETQVYGGTLGNFAMVAAKLGLDFHPYAAVSSETHSSYLELLSSRGIDTSHVKVFDGVRGPFCYIASDRNKQLAFINQGPNRDWKPSLDNGLLDGYEILHFSTGPREEYLELARKTGARIVFDPSQEARLYNDREMKEFLSLAEIVMCNEQEYELMSPSMSKDTPKTVIKTLGARGVEITNEGRKIEIRGKKVENIHDTIGAGDAFRAGFYAALYREKRLEKAVEAGIFTASAAIEAPIFDFSLRWDDIEKLLDKAT